MNRVVETLIYRLKPGTGAAFDRIMRDVSVPLHRRAGTDVVAYANSLHDPDAYILIRAYDDPDHLRASQDAFYGERGLADRAARRDHRDDFDKPEGHYRSAGGRRGSTASNSSGSEPFSLN